MRTRLRHLTSMECPGPADIASPPTSRACSSSSFHQSACRCCSCCSRLSAYCCPLAPAHHSAPGLAINICDVLVEEGGPRVKAKRRGGDPLPRARRRATSRERVGSRVFGCVAGSWTKSQRTTQPKTRGDARQAREGLGPAVQAASVDAAMHCASASSEGRLYSMRRGLHTAGCSRSAGGRLGVRLIIQSPARTRSRLENTTRSLAG